MEPPRLLAPKQSYSDSLRNASQEQSLIQASDKEETNPPNIRASVKSKQEWESQKENFRQLYVDEGLPLRQVMKIMRERYGFEATEKQYKTKVKQWEMPKYAKSKEVLSLVKQVQQELESSPNKQSAIRLKRQIIELLEGRSNVNKRDTKEQELPRAGSSNRKGQIPPYGNSRSLQAHNMKSLASKASTMQPQPIRFARHDANIPYARDPANGTSSKGKAPVEDNYSYLPSPPSTQNTEHSPNQDKLSGSFAFSEHDETLLSVTPGQISSSLSQDWPYSMPDSAIPKDYEREWWEDLPNAIQDYPGSGLQTQFNSHKENEQARYVWPPINLSEPFDWEATFASEAFGALAPWGESTLAAIPALPTYGHSARVDPAAHDLYSASPAASSTVPGESFDIVPNVAIISLATSVANNDADQDRPHRYFGHEGGGNIIRRKAPKPPARTGRVSVTESPASYTALHSRISPTQERIMSRTTEENHRTSSPVTGTESVAALAPTVLPSSMSADDETAYSLTEPTDISKLRSFYLPQSSYIGDPHDIPTYRVPRAGSDLYTKVSEVREKQPSVEEVDHTKQSARVDEVAERPGSEIENMRFTSMSFVQDFVEEEEEECECLDTTELETDFVRESTESHGDGDIGERGREQEWGDFDGLTELFEDQLKLVSLESKVY